MTNWDKLVLDVKTDGTISPEEAFNEAVKILVEQYKALLPENIGKEMAAEAEVAAAETEEIAEVEETVEEEEEEPVVAKKEKKEKVKKPKK
jgi:DNA-directed RNA polymerase alpha subunit